VLNWIEGPIWVALGVAISLLSYRTGIGSFSEPGAGFVAFGSGIFMIVIGSIRSIARGGTSGQKAGEPGEPSLRKTTGRPSYRRVYTLVLLVLYALLLNSVGYVITTFLVMFGLFFDPEKRRFAAPLFASLASVAVTYTLFEIWLKTQLPRGLFPWW
jgi:hypothetical protein